MAYEALEEPTWQMANQATRNWRRSVLYCHRVQPTCLSIHPYLLLTSGLPSSATGGRGTRCAAPSLARLSLIRLGGERLSTRRITPLSREHCSSGSSKRPSVLWSQLRSWQRIWGIVGQRFHEVSAAIEDHAEEGAWMAISSNAGECQSYLQAALVVVRRFRLAHSCSCSGDGRDRLPHASPSSLTLPFNITHNLHGPSRRRTSPKVSLNSSVTPGFMMCWCCLLLSNSHEEVAAPLPPAHPEGRHQSLHGRKVFTGLAAERAPVRVPAAWRAWPQLKVWRSGTQPPWVARRFPRGRCVFLVLVVEASDENHEAPPAPRSPCTPAWRTSSSS